MPLLILLALSLVARPLLAQDAYRDPVARQLVERARETRERADRSISSYTGVVRQRSAVMLRLPLRDRLLEREEMAARVHWSRDGETVVRLLASREQGPDGVEAGGFDTNTIFDPSGDRVYFVLAGSIGDSEEMWIAHPLAANAEDHYRYASGDTMTVRLPDQRVIRAVELHVIPRRPSFHYLTAALWIEPESGALVQAVYRPARSLDFARDTAFIDADDLDALDKVPGFLKPFEIDFENVVVQYSLWGLRHWLPRLMRVEGYFRAGSMRVPFSQELSYQMESVSDAPDAAPTPTAAELARAEGDSLIQVVGEEQNGRRRTTILRPKDDSRLIRSEELPPPIWDESPEFASESELEALVDKLKVSVPRGTIREPVSYGVQWGTDAPDLIRFNRVEGLSMGARATVRYAEREARATVRLGIADLRPNLELAASQPAAGRAVTASVYHQLASVDGTGQALGMGNSAGALLFGRDYGEYYRATGARLTVAPAARDRQWYRWSLFAERQRGAERGTTWSLARLLGSEHAFRPNLAADDADLLGASLALSPWWGRDPLAPQAGVEYLAEAATGDHRFVRSRVTGRTILPLGRRHRFGLEAAAGESWGTTPVQYHWFLGGPETLRGYGGSAAAGPTFARGRAELARGTPTGAITLFADAGWAGERSAFATDDVLVAAGVGTSLLDGLLRLDLARSLTHEKGWRLELYLDALM